MNQSDSFAEPRKVAPRLRGQRIPAPNPQLFEDTSLQSSVYAAYPQSSQMDYDMQQTQYDHSQGYGGTGGGYGAESGTAGGTGGGYGAESGTAGFMFPGQRLLNDPVANMAVQYSQTLAGQGTEFVHKNIERYVATSKLKYYFAVDTAYVGKKLGLLLFPFAHSDWSLKYSPDEPIAPRYDSNAPDLYIPVMSFVTYVLLAGVLLGTQSRFTPEDLGITASTALIWTTIEILALLFSMYVMNVSSSLKLLDLLSYCGYKYVGMIVVLLSSLIFHSAGYYVGLTWMSLSIAFFLVRSLHVVIMTPTDSESFSHGNKRRLYTLLVVALTQPALIWWLTRRLAIGDTLP